MRKRSTARMKASLIILIFWIVQRSDCYEDAGQRNSTLIAEEDEVNSPVHFSPITTDADQRNFTQHIVEEDEVISPSELDISQCNFSGRVKNCSVLIDGRITVKLKQSSSMSSPSATQSIFSSSTTLSPSTPPSADSLSPNTTLIKSLATEVSVTSSWNTNNSSTSTKHDFLQTPPTIPLNCLTNLGIDPQAMYLSNQTQFPLDCMQEALCSGERKASIITVENKTFYWFKNMSLQCSARLFPRIENWPSISGELSGKEGFVLLNPTCKPSREFAYLEGLAMSLPILPKPCRQLLCYAGVDEVHYSKLPVSLIYPHVSSNYDLVDICQKELDDNMQNRNISSKSGHINIFHTSAYPRESPCSTYTVFLVTDNYSHLIIPFRSTWCRLVKENSWSNLLFSSYTGFLKGTQLKLYQCILEKRQKQISRYTEYDRLLQDLTGRYIKVPDVPKSCLFIFCDTKVEILSIRHSNKDVLYWFSHVIYTKENQRSVLDMQMLRCSRDLNNTRRDSFHSKASISLPGFDGETPISLLPTTNWSCPNVHTVTENSHLKAQVLATLWIKHRDLPEACRPYVCDGTVKRMSDSIFSIAVIFDINHPKTCQKYATYKTLYSEKEFMFSFKVIQTNISVVFIISQSHKNEKTMEFFSYLLATEYDHKAECCINTHEDITHNMYSFGENDYYMCQVNSSNSFVHPCLLGDSLWQKKSIQHNKYLIIIKDTLINSRFIHWLATLNVNFSALNLKYISSLESFSVQFLNNFIFAVNNQKVKGKHFLEFISQTQNANISCRRSHRYTVCYDPNDKFEASTHRKGYLVFLHDCYIGPMDKDKLTLILLNKFLGSGPSEDYLCENDIVAVMIPSVSKYISYNTSNSEKDTLIIDQLKKETSSYSWLERESSQTNELDSKPCVEFSAMKMISDYLEKGYCINYIYNTSVISLKAHQKYLFNFQTFPLGEPESDMYNLNLLRTSNFFSSYPVRYVVEFSNITINITILEQNPSQRIFKVNRLIDLNTQKTNSIHWAKLMMKATLANDNKCLQNLQSHNFLLSASDHIFWIGPIIRKPNDSSCFPFLSNDTIDLLQESITSNSSTINKFWPTCSYNMIVSWRGRPSDVRDWDYLSSSCKTQEIMLMILTATLIFIMVTGNIWAIVMISKHNLHQNFSFIMYISHSVSDLLLGIFPGILSIADTLRLMTGFLTFQELNPHFWEASLHHLQSHGNLDLTHLTFKRYGFPVFCSIIFSLAMGSSLLTLLLQGLERFCLIIRRPMNRHQIISGTYLCWVISGIFSITTNLRQSNWNFVGLFDPVTKLTLNTKADETLMNSVIFYLISCTFAVSWLIILVTATCLSVLSNINSYQQHTVLPEGEMDFYDDARQVNKIFQWKAGLFASACFFLLLDGALDLSNVSPISHFFIWLIFLVLMSLKWTVFVLKTSTLRQELGRLFCQRRQSKTSKNSQLFLHINNSTAQPTQPAMEMNALKK